MNRRVEVESRGTLRGEKKEEREKRQRRTEKRRSKKCMTDKNVAALHIRGEKRQILSVLSRFSARQRSLATLRKDRAFGMRIIGSDYRDRTDQDYKDYDNMTAITSSPKVFLHFVGTFLSVYVSERIRVRAAFLQEKLS